MNIMIENDEYFDRYRDVEYYDEEWYLQMNIMIEYHDVKYYDEELYLHMKEMHRGTDWLRDFHVKGPKTWPATKRALLKTTKKWQVCFQNRHGYITNIYHWLMDFQVKREKT